jgi:hypothetical protein
MRYFKHHWDEYPIGRADWGSSWWYFETDDAGVVIRQIEVYERGPTLRYDENHVYDEFGGLTDQALEFTDFEEFEILPEEFGRIWSTDA